MSKVYTVQPAPKTDYITEDGTELTQLPYPFHVNADGSIRRQEFWSGKPAEVVGFAADLARHEVDLWWDETVADPQKAVGMYLVTRNTDGSMATHLTAVESVEITEVPS